MKQLLSILLLALMAATVTVAQNACDMIGQIITYARDKANSGNVDGALAALRQAQNEPELRRCPNFSRLAEEIRRIENQQSSSSSTTTFSSGQNITVTVNGVSFTMIFVKGGTFQMGATSEQGSDAQSDEKPAHSVTLSNFYIGETEVTQALWQAVMGENPSNWKGSNLPVEMVSWNDCQTFITKLNQLTGRRFRLPTEAEWEYAARGGTKSRGYKYSGSNTLSSVAWYWENSGDKILSGDWRYDKITANHCKTHPVKQKTPNELGIYDMSGNVWEWCQDWYASYSSSAQTNPQGPASASSRVCRGGGWDYSARLCRVARRDSSSPGVTLLNLGLRLAL